MSKYEDEVNWGPHIHDQFKRQAKWTEDFRNQIFRQINLRNAKKILEVGCGTGVITEELKKKSNARITAVDIDEKMVEVARKYVEGVHFLVEDAEKLSMKKETFDIVISQYLFLWLSNPLNVLNQMIKVCKKGGYVIALAEPDYGGWIEYPEMNLGRKHVQSLEQEGADPRMGRKMLTMFEKAGLKTYQIIVAQSWNQENLRNNIEEEWRRVLESGLITEEEFDDILEKERELIEKNQRMIFMPVFSVIGKK
ncbi:methyltransferase domain-containing protein [Candidatus Heimdallarchaeota archaeon]|nr:MAG: methyltransferase domain-containing protein [Candidatus Heimdallarchaeota archaeon]